MKKFLKLPDKGVIKNLCVVLISVVVLPLNTYASYTYTYDQLAERESPDAYTPQRIWSGDNFGIGDFRNPAGIFADGNILYICDTGNNRIVVLEEKDNQFTLLEVISEIEGDVAVATLNQPTDIFVTENGDRYIADKMNSRILHITAENEFVREILKPVDETIALDALFRPSKLVVDHSGRIVVQVEGYNQGLLQLM